MSRLTLALALVGVLAAPAAAVPVVTSALRDLRVDGALTDGDSSSSVPGPRFQSANAQEFPVTGKESAVANLPSDINFRVTAPARLAALDVFPPDPPNAPRTSG